MIEFKQIIGRGTRIFEKKDYFTIYDFVNAYHHFSDPEWDGEPIEPEDYETSRGKKMKVKEPIIEYPEKKEKIKIKLKDGKEREIQHMITTSFWSADGKPISSEEFIQKIYGDLPKFFKDEEQLRRIWESPITRKAFLIKLAESGYGIEQLKDLQKMISAEKSDLFDVLAYISFALKPITREERVAKSQHQIFNLIDDKQKEFLEFVLSKYIETGIEELAQKKLPELLKIKYQEISDATQKLGGVREIQKNFIGFQKYLYAVVK